MFKLSLKRASLITLLLTGCSDSAIITDKNPCWFERKGNFNLKGNVVIAIQKYGSVRIVSADCGDKSVGIKLSQEDGKLSDRLFDNYRNTEVFWIEVDAYVEGKKIGDRDQGNLAVEIEELRIGTSAPTTHVLKPQKPGA